MPEPAAEQSLAPEDTCPGLPEGIRRSKAAIRRDLPKLLTRRRNRGKWVLYHGDECVAIGTPLFLIGEINRRNIPDGEYVIDRIDARAGSEEEEEIDPPSGGF